MQYILNGLEQGTPYEFQVIAKGNGITYDNSDASSSVQWTTQAKLATPVITTTKDTNSITVNWSTIANATGYVVEYKLSTASNYTPLETVTAPTTTKVIPNLTSGATYKIHVKAISSNAAYYESDYSTDATVVVSTQLDTPNPTYTSDESSIRATWSAIQNAASYRVYYKLSNDSSYSDPPDTVTASASPEWTKGSLTSGAVYSIYVQAVAAANSDYTDSDNSTATNVTVKTKLATPTNLAISERTTNSLTLTWTGDNRADGYDVYYKEGSNPYQSAPASTNSFPLSSLGEGETYTFYVIAKGSGNYLDSASSSTVSGTTKITLAAPTGLAADNVQSTTADINWNKSANATGYKITVSDANGAITGYNNRALGDVNTLSIAGLTQTKEYTVSLVATSTSDDYVDSVPASLVFTTDTKLGTVSTPTLTKTTDSITIDWSPVSGADSYLVQYRETGSGDSGWKSEPVPGSANPPCQFELSPLAQGASYQFRVKAVTNNPAYEDGDYSEIVSTSTLIKLDTPTGLNVTNIQLTEATLNWNDVEHNSGYIVKYRKVGTSEWMPPIEVEG